MENRLRFVKITLCYCKIMKFRFQIQGYNEYFRDTCGGVSAWLNQVLRFAAFSEGWGLYAEALIGQKTNAYEGRPLMKYGWLKWQVRRNMIET